MASSADTSSTVLSLDAVEKDIEKTRHIELIRSQTNGTDMKNEERIDDDSVDSDPVPRLTFSRLMTLISMIMLFTGSQIPLFLLGPAQAFITDDIGGSDRAVWYILGNLITLASMAPFVGSLSDLIGRRWAALIGAWLLVIGMIVATTATSMNAFIAGMVISGGGAGINELIAVAVTTEIAPTAQRGKYVAVMMLSLLPLTPGIFWAQLVASRSPRAWRYLGLWAGIWAGLGMVLTFIFFHPPPRVNSLGLSRREILAQIDWVGGLLSIGGTIFFIMGLLWGGYQYSWESAHVLVTVILGALMLVAFAFWETYWAKYPMFPRRLKKAPRTLGLMLLITFISGVDFFAILVFWPIESYNVYGHDPIANGWRSLPIIFSLMIGTCVVLVCLSLFRGQNRSFMVASTSFMTIGTALMAVLTPDNVVVAYVLNAIAGLGIGGLAVPVAVMTTIVCPDDLIATVSALSLSIRILGGAIGYSIYFNVLYSKLIPNLQTAIMGACIEAQMFNATTAKEIGMLLSVSLNDRILPLLGDNQTKADIFVHAAEAAFSMSYRWVYYVSIPFGIISVIAACFVEDLSPYMDNHVAVVYN